MCGSGAGQSYCWGDLAVRGRRTQLRGYRRFCLRDSTRSDIWLIGFLILHTLDWKKRALGFEIGKKCTKGRVRVYFVGMCPYLARLFVLSPFLDSSIILLFIYYFFQILGINFFCIVYVTLRSTILILVRMKCPMVRSACYKIFQRSGTYMTIWIRHGGIRRKIHCRLCINCYGTGKWLSVYVGGRRWGVAMTLPPATPH